MKSLYKIQRQMALIAGYSLLAMAILAGFAYGYSFESIYVAGDAQETLINLNNSEILFRSFIFSFVVILILDVVIAWATYVLFKPVNHALSLLSACLRLVYSALLGVALLNLLVVLQLLDNVPQNETNVMNSLKVFLDMWSMGLIVFGCHLFALGCLALLSDFIPKILAIFTVFAATCYFGSNTASLLLSNYEQYKATVDIVLGLPMALGELGLAGWFIFKWTKTR